MTYTHTTVRCPRCESNIEIISGSIPTDIFRCPVCSEGEINHKSNQPELHPVSVGPQNNQRLEQYITTLSNIWVN